MNSAFADNEEVIVNENLTFSYTAYQGWYSAKDKTIASTMELKNSDGVVLVKEILSPSTSTYLSHLK